MLTCFGHLVYMTKKRLNTTRFIIVESKNRILDFLLFIFFNLNHMMYLCILLFPLLSFLFTNLAGRFIGINGSCILATTSIILSFLFSCLAFYEVGLCGSQCYIAMGP